MVVVIVCKVLSVKGDVLKFKSGGVFKIRNRGFIKFLDEVVLDELRNVGGGL